MPDSPPELQKLVRDSNLIFSGTVVELGASSVANLAPRDNFAVVSVDRSLRCDAALGDLRRKKVTVELLDQGGLQPDQRSLFFTSNWIQGGGIAVREVARIETQQEDGVAAEVARLPERHLAERLADSTLVVLAEVAETRSTPFDIRWRNAPQWATASFRNIEALQGEPNRGHGGLVSDQRTANVGARAALKEGPAWHLPVAPSPGLATSPEFGTEPHLGDLHRVRPGRCRSPCPCGLWWKNCLGNGGSDDGRARGQHRSGGAQR